MNRQQKARVVLFMVLLTSLGVLVRHLILRGRLGSSAVADPGTQADEPPPWSLVQAMVPAEQQRRLLRAARLRLAGGTEDSAEPAVESPDLPSPRLVFLSLGRRQAPAWVGRGEGGSLEEGLLRAADDLARRAAKDEIDGGLLKVDVLAWRGGLETFDEEGRSRVDRSLDGVWLQSLDLDFLPEELLAGRLMDSEGDLLSKRLRTYLQAGLRPGIPSKNNPGRKGMGYRRLRFISFAEAPQGESRPLYRGNPLAPGSGPENLLAAARAGGDYLLRHLRDDGFFDYLYEAKEDRFEDDYNLLRHAGSCYALAELSQATGDTGYLEGAEKGLEGLLTKTRAPLKKDLKADGGRDFLAVVSPGEEAKLGGAALTLLALLKVREVRGEPFHDATALELGEFLLHQQESDGHFASKYFYGPPDDEPFESIYYPGEAILALTRLSRVDPDPRWRRAAEAGARWLIEVRDQGKTLADLPHDHWLLMGLSELDGPGEEPLFRDHGRRIGEAILGAQRLSYPEPDWIGSFYSPPRATPTATRAEALVALTRLARRHSWPDEPYLKALERMAAFQLRCQFVPENTFYLPRPDRALGGFRRSLTDWEVRIDYVQHNVSALLGYRTLLLETPPG